jgi:hypothetical protein
MFVVLAEGLNIFRLGAIATGGRRLRPGNLSFAKITGWMDVWELNPERLGLH